jgi:hypothetical protein
MNRAFYKGMLVYHMPAPTAHGLCPLKRAGTVSFEKGRRKGYLYGSGTAFKNLYAIWVHNFTLADSTPKEA